MIYMLKLNRCHKISPETGIRAVLPEETLKVSISVLEDGSRLLRWAD